MADDEALEAMLEVIGVLDSLEVDYLVGGSLASSFHGIPRSTLDADLVADLRSEHVEGLSRALASSFYIDRDSVQDAVRSQSSFNIIFLNTMFKVDIFVLKNDPLSREEMRRRKTIPLDETATTTIAIASAEDTVLQKLIWFKAGGGVSDRQWQDLQGVLKVCRSSLDLDYLKRWANYADIAEELAHALREAGL